MGSTCHQKGFATAISTMTTMSTAGASLIQVYTGWIYQGPGLVPAILEGLGDQLDRHGCSHLSEVMGSGLPWR